MTTALQQQVFALDARYNANRAPNCPGFRKYSIRFIFFLSNLTTNCEQVRCIFGVEVSYYEKQNESLINGGNI